MPVDVSSYNNFTGGFLSGSTQMAGLLAQNAPAKQQTQGYLEGLKIKQAQIGLDIQQKTLDATIQNNLLENQMQHAQLDLATTSQQQNYGIAKQNISLQQQQLAQTTAYQTGELGLRGQELTQTGQYQQAQIGLSKEQLGLAQSAQAYQQNPNNPQNLLALGQAAMANRQATAPYSELGKTISDISVIQSGTLPGVGGQQGPGNSILPPGQSPAQLAINMGIKAPEGFMFNEPFNPSAGVRPIPGAKTQEPQNAVKIGLLNNAANDFGVAQSTFQAKDGSLNTGKLAERHIPFTEGNKAFDAYKRAIFQFEQANSPRGVSPEILNAAYEQYLPNISDSYAGIKEKMNSFQLAVKIAHQSLMGTATTALTPELISKGLKAGYSLEDIKAAAEQLGE